MTEHDVIAAAEPPLECVVRPQRWSGVCSPHANGGFVAVGDYMEMERRFTIAKRQWDSWKAYAMELQARLVKYEGGSVMHLNGQGPNKEVSGARSDD